MSLIWRKVDEQRFGVGAVCIVQSHVHAGAPVAGLAAVVQGVMSLKVVQAEREPQANQSPVAQEPPSKHTGAPLPSGMMAAPTAAVGVT